MTKEQHQELDQLRREMDEATKAADDAKHFKTRVEREYGTGGNIMVNLCNYGRDVVMAFATSNEEALQAAADAATQAYEALLSRFEELVTDPEGGEG